MKFVIITHVQHIKSKNNYFGYAPYIREMNMWLKYVDEVIVVAPLVNKELTAIYDKYNHSNLNFHQVQEFEITSKVNLIRTLVKLPKIFIQVYKAMSKADYIHLRCPGNMGLLGAIVQIAFPKIPKTAKYAGNWDPKAKQPWSYRLQKWILSNTVLTRNMQVLVYGEWEGISKNIKPFFTATYSEKDKIALDSFFANRLVFFQQSEIRFLFVGTLSKGKQPLYAIQLVEQLIQSGYAVRLDFFGEGLERKELEIYIFENGLHSSVFLQGNQSADRVRDAYQQSHFLILPSQSEGWPKVVAEAMFWGCVPIATSVSCVPTMLNQEERGLLLTMDIKKDIQLLRNILDQESIYQSKATHAAIWSRQYTVDYFESEIRKLVQGVMLLKRKNTI